MSNGNFEVDLNALQGEVNKMSLDEFTSSLLKSRTTQKKAQMKQHGTDAQKKSQARQREKNKLFKSRALETPATKGNFANLWEQIEAQSKSAAEAKISEEVVEAVNAEG